MPLLADARVSMSCITSEDTKQRERFSRLHSYFTVSSLEDLEFTGTFQRKEFFNKLVGDGGEMQTEERSAFSIAEESDRVYTGINDPHLKGSGTGKAVRSC
jgi:D-hexose-6-phosphate mutarotase